MWVAWIEGGHGRGERISGTAMGMCREKAMVS
jgi:hypothetical protein